MVLESNMKLAGSGSSHLSASSRAPAFGRKEDGRTLITQRILCTGTGVRGKGSLTLFIQMHSLIIQIMLYKVIKEDSERWLGVKEQVRKR